MKSDVRSASTETFESLRLRIRDRFAQLSPHLQRLARAALDEPNAFALKTISTMSREIGVQPSTLIRFAKEFGYSGFSDMQKVFRLRLIEGAALTRETVYSDGSSQSAEAELSDILKKCVDAHIQSLRALTSSVSPETLAEAVSMMSSARHIMVAGLRRSRPIATYLFYGLVRSERHCSLVDFGSGMAGQQVSNMTPDDLLVAIAFPPYSQPVIDLVMDAALRGRRIVSITDTADSPLARHSTISFHIGANAKSQYQPISGAIGLAQTLVTALGQ